MKIHRYNDEELEYIKKEIETGKTFPQIANGFNKKYKTNITALQMQQAMWYRGIHSKNKSGGNTHKPIGTISTRMTTYRGKKVKQLFIKVEEPDKWISYRIYLYEEKYGRIPQNSILISINRNINDINPDNQYPVTKRELAVINRQNLKWYDRESLKCCVAFAKYQNKLVDLYGENWRRKYKIGK